MERKFWLAIRNNRLLLPVILAIVFVMLFPAAASASASASSSASGGTLGESAEICRDLGVLRGGINGVDAAYLSSFATRLQAMSITIRLIGKESVASSYKWTSNFNDAALVDYESGRNILAYIKAHPELGWMGDRFGNIDPSGYLTPQAMYKVLLNILGYSLDEDFQWDGTVEFAASMGMRAMSSKRGFLTNDDIAVMIVEALKTRKKYSDDTLCEYLVDLGIINCGTAYAAAVFPGSAGYKPLLSYNDGGPLLSETRLFAEQKKISIKFNIALNPTYAKALSNYNYYMPGTGYIPLPSRCSTTMSDECTVVIQFPSVGWIAFSDRTEVDAFFMYIASDRKNELRASGLYDVDDKRLRDVYIDVQPPLKTGGSSTSSGGYVNPGGAAVRNPSQYLR